MTDFLNPGRGVAPLLAFLAAFFCAASAIWFPGTTRARRLVPAGGALLVGTVFFGLIPELGTQIGWLLTVVLVAAGFGLLVLLDRSGISGCPSCSESEGFAVALLVATGLHALVDGWALSVSGTAGSPGSSSVSLSIAILLHKVPEGLALGTILRAGLPGQPPMRKSIQILCAFVAEFPTLAGGLLGSHTPPGPWLYGPLALAGGTFLFLGFHAMRGVRENSSSN